MFAFISLLLFSFAPYLSVRAAQDEDALTTEALKNVVSVDYKEYFGDLDGSFVLYDMQEDTWYVYNRAQAERRISPGTPLTRFTTPYSAWRKGSSHPTPPFCPGTGRPIPLRPGTPIRIWHPLWKIL